MCSRITKGLEKKPLFLYNGCMIKAVINDSELVSHINSLEKDGMSIFVMADGQFRGALFHGTRFINQMRANHNLGILETMVLGQACLCGALMIPTMKGKERLRLRYDTNGPAAGFSVEADSTGYVRGYLLQDRIPVEKPLENWDLAPFLGPGTVSVTRFPEGRAEPMTGTVEIKHRNIAKDLAWYFLQSEQINTAFNTSIQLDKKGRVVGAGGLFLQTLPGANEEVIQRVEMAFEASPSYGQWFSEKGGRDDIIYGLFREFNPSVALERDVVFDCPCSKDVFERHILNLDRKELSEIVETNPEEPVETVCHYCGSVYKIDKRDLKAKMSEKI